MTTEPEQDREQQVIVHAIGLDDKQFNALFDRVATAAHVLDEEVFCSAAGRVVAPHVEPGCPCGHSCEHGPHDAELDHPVERIDTQPDPLVTELRAIREAHVEAVVQRRINHRNGDVDSEQILGWDGEAHQAWNGLYPTAAQLITESEVDHV